jgi:NADPH:quinone reductase-like Zn-dependent oxidoreductase
MRALAIAGRDQAAAVQDVPSPAAAAGEVRIAVEAASVNGIDATAAAGYLWDMLPHEFPVVLGRDFAGTTPAGERVTGVITDLSLGLRGAIAEAVTVPASSVVRVPSGIDATRAAGLGLAGVTAHDLVSALALSDADTVLVSGATGGVGAFAVQLAARTGATVIATARPGEAADFVRTLGAAHWVDYAGDLAAQVAAAAPGGATAVVHAAGDPSALAAVLAPGGRLATALGATEEQVGRDEVTVIPVMGAASPEKLTALLAEVASGVLSVPIARTYPLAEAAEAVADFGAHKLGKLVVTVP